MPFATLFSNVSAMLFGPSALGAADDPDRPIIEALIEAVVDAVDPRLRMVSKYREQLAPGMKQAIAHLRELARALPEPRELSRAAWGADPLICAMLATANDVPALLGRSHELRAFFDAPANAAASECHALLGARLEEKNVLGTALVGETLQREVAQKQVNFSGQRLIAPAADLLACRREVGTRILRRLAALVLERIESNAQRVKELDERKVVLGVRLRMLTLHRGGLESLAGDAKDESAEIQKIERALEATVDSYVETKGNLATLEGMIGLVNEVYGAAAAHIALAPVRRRLSRMGIVVPAGSTESATDLEFPQLSIGEGMRFVMTFVRVPRAELPPKEDLVKNAARYL